VPLSPTFLWGGGVLQYPEIFVLLRTTLFLEIATSHSEPNQRNGGGVFHFSNRFLGQKPLDKEWALVNTVMNLRV
jgi:hypothetical protein